MHTSSGGWLSGGLQPGDFGPGLRHESSDVEQGSIVESSKQHDQKGGHIPAEVNPWTVLEENVTGRNRWIIGNRQVANESAFQTHTQLMKTTQGTEEMRFTCATVWSEQGRRKIAWRTSFRICYI
ncbi:hypothetical protein STEG23_021670 [Scotinomys teguina]